MGNSNYLETRPFALVRAASAATQRFDRALRASDPEMAAHSDAVRRLGIHA
jgi:hypothetical protein